MKKYTRSADFYADRIDVIKNFAVITNVVLKRVHCIAKYPLTSKNIKFGHINYFLYMSARDI